MAELGPSRVGVGVLTVLSTETHAVLETFRGAGEHRPVGHDGLRFHEATFNTRRGPITAVLLQTLDRGQRSAAAAYGNLLRHYHPAVVMLVGIAGGISPRAGIGDVVIADQVIYYDGRRTAASATHHRGEATLLPARAAVVVNDLFSTEGEPFPLLSPLSDRPFQVMRGPIGSGEAVITDEDSDIRAYLQTFNERCLAVETEAGGVVQAAREDMRVATSQAAWLVVRGISDHADAAKGHRDHDLAAGHAASVFEHLLPYLAVTSGEPKAGRGRSGVRYGGDRDSRVGGPGRGAATPPADRRRPRRGTVAVLSVARSGAVATGWHTSWRAALSAAIDEAIADTPLEGAEITEHRSGAAVFAPESVPPVRVAARFARALDVALADHDPDGGMRLKVALHSGRIDGGARRGATEEADALVHEPVLDDVLRHAPRARVVLAVPDEFYDTVVRRHPRFLDPSTFQRAAGSAPAAAFWVSVPAYRSPPPVPGLRAIGA